MRGLFITATDTGAGKTVLSAALAAAMVASGERVRAHKPVLTGLEQTPHEATGEAWPPDHELLGLVAGMSSQEVAPLRFGPAASPHLAAQLAGAAVSGAELLAATQAAGARAQTVIVEGVGGLLVPLADDYMVRDLAVALGLPVVIAARPGLGTINHTLLTLHAARAALLDVRAVVLTPWPPRPDAIELSNRETIARLGEIEVEVLARVPRPEPGELARAGEALPWRRWLAARAA